MSQKSQEPVQRRRFLKRAATGAVAGGAQLRPPPNDILRQSYKHTKDLYAEMSAANPAFKKIYDHLWAFQQDSTRYWQISDLSFDLMSATALQQRWQDG